MDEQTPIADKALLFPQKGMKGVNALFILSVFFYQSRFIFLAYLAWALYLLRCLRHLGKEESRTVYYVLLAFAVGMICVNLFFMLQR